MPLTYCTTHPEDAPGILHYQSGSEAYGRLGLTDKSPPDPLHTSQQEVHNVGNTAFWTFVPLVYCTPHLEDASGILHF